jgi:hypothetical protein
LIVVRFPTAPEAGRGFQLSGSGVSAAGFIADDGRVEVDVPAATKTLKLSLEAEEEGPPAIDFQVRVEALPPVSSAAGFLARLRNLGYYPEALAEEQAAEQRSALEEFQCDNGLKVDGIKGPKTEAKMLEVHGS